MKGHIAVGCALAFLESELVVRRRRTLDAEIEDTRKSEHLMRLLRQRAEDPPVVSLQEVKERLDLK